ncbi:hypothetical protein GGR21_001995 [Dysgonomonas hofstadii]|uniref:DUF4625 domain-containing protein n=1 Tax=Dysgonomonas hofstadii TaxID=637886 RepID=A0A840CR66_9BACT|nr:hypothetical protein [Dysgonomonas hofstadii]MBB4036094.1 hypothetical protein [Dysgonomonas hofstadii]
MKKLLLTALLIVSFTLSLIAQQVQTSGGISVSLESTRVIGDRLLISGKMTADKVIRAMNLKLSVIDSDGDGHDLKVIWWGGKKESSIISFDKELQPGIPYSFDFSIETQSKNMNPITAILLNIRDWTHSADIKMQFKDIPVPVKADPNLKPGVMEIGKDIYLKWVKAEESASGLKINFVVENKANKDQEMSFRSYSNGKIIDKDGNIYEAALTLKDAVTFPSKTPIAGSISIKQPIKMADVIMVQFESGYFKYSVKDLTFAK